MLAPNKPEKMRPTALFTAGNGRRKATANWQTALVAGVVHHRAKQRNC